AAQTARTGDLGAGKLLVATRQLGDPNFAETVVLLVHYDDESVLGLIVNRQSRIPLSRLFQDVKSAKGLTDPAYLGGPVEKNAAMALVRSRTEPEDSEHVFADVHVTSSKAVLEKALEGGAEASRFRVYVGYSGWTARQLDREVELGAWRIFPGDAGAVFDADP